MYQPKLKLMTMIFKKLFLLTICISASLIVNAQDDGFDLSSQRSESQDVNPVPGMIQDHKGLVINPVPQEMTLYENGFIDLACGFKLKDRKGVFGHDLGFMSVGDISLVIDFGTRIAEKRGVKMIPGAYQLTIGKKGIEITGYDEKGAFYGIQTLKQILDSDAAGTGSIPYMHIDDWPDLKYRGVVEGFYGEPWSHEVRLSLIDFYGRFKMNCYLYGPKDDPFHSSPDWRLPYPQEEARQIQELVEACRRNRVDFVWAIHPGKDIRWNLEDYDNLVNKFEMMYDLGVRSFALFFDDISGEGTNPVKQTELVNDLNRDFVHKKEDVTNLIVCPTDYSKLWADPSPTGSLSIYGRTMDPSVELFWTGDVVCSDLTVETMQWFNSRVQRPGFYWWNYPVTDYARHILMQGPVYGLSNEMTSEDLCGLVSNPMEHGEASKLALYGVADYTWNVAAYNPIDNWERGLAVLAPEVKDAYRTFAIHSCDTETGYRRAESWETVTFDMDTYTQEKYDALMAEFVKIEQVPSVMENCSNPLLLSELRPWLVEFGKLGTRGRKTLECLELYRKGDMEAFWNAYSSNLMTDEEKASYNAHKSGTMKLQPFYENMMDDLAVSCYERVAGRPALRPVGIGTYPTLGTTQNKFMFDYDEDTFFNSGDSQREGHWIGVDLGSVRPVTEVQIRQGKNSVNDNDFYDHLNVEASADGRNWTVLVEGLKNAYEVNWKGDAVEARYVRMRKLESEKTSWTVVRSFLVNPVPEEDFASDENPFTASTVETSVSFEIPSDASGVVLLMGELNDGEVVIRQKDASGNCIDEISSPSSFVKHAICEGAVTLELTGTLELFETIFTI